MMRFALIAIAFLDLGLLFLSLKPESDAMDPRVTGAGQETPWMLRRLQCSIELPEGSVLIRSEIARMRNRQMGFLRFGALKVLELSPFEASLFPRGAASPTTRLRSDAAVVDMATKDVTFRGSVSIEDPSGRRFSFSRLEWKEETRRLVSTVLGSLSAAGTAVPVRDFSAGLDLTDVRYDTVRPGR
jgi:hypothetical protein